MWYCALLFIDVFLFRASLFSIHFIFIQTLFIFYATGARIRAIQFYPCSSGRPGPDHFSRSGVMPLDLTKTILMFLQNNLDSVYANHLKLISQCIWQYMGQHRLWLLFLLRFQRYALNIWLPCSMFEYNVIFTMTYRL